MIRRYTVALMQMDTQNDKGKNLETACAWIDEAAAKGAKLICFPEVMNLIGKNIGEGGGREEIPGYTTERLCAKAKEHGVYIHGGSITQALPGEKRSANTSVLISPEGKILATYSKLHMFDITLADGTPYRESDRVKPGDSIVTVETELGIFGMSICYDVRFPEIYRLMALRGAQVIFVPASFTMPTGKDHWEVLLRARDRASNDRYGSVIRDAKEYIRANFSQSDLSLNRIAVHIGVSPSYFSSIFKQETGQSFVEYLTQVRMERACELLKCTSYRTSEIGEQVGYNDSHYFSSAFKKAMGQSPKEYKASQTRQE